MILVKRHTVCFPTCNKTLIFYTSNRSWQADTFLDIISEVNKWLTLFFTLSILQNLQTGHDRLTQPFLGIISEVNRWLALPWWLQPAQRKGHQLKQNSVLFSLLFFFSQWKLINICQILERFPGCFFLCDFFCDSTSALHWRRGVGVGSQDNKEQIIMIMTYIYKAPFLTGAHSALKLLTTFAWQNTQVPQTQWVVQI